MSEQLLIPNPSLHDVVTYKIIVEGSEVDPGLKLLPLSISKEINRIPFAKIVFRDGDASEQKFEISDMDFFIPGKMCIRDSPLLALHK